MAALRGYSRSLPLPQTGLGAPYQALHRFSRAVNACLLILALLGSVLVVMQFSTTKASAAQPPRRLLSGWLPYWDSEDAMASVENHAELFTDASPFWYTLRSDGTVGPSCASCLSESSMSQVVQRLHNKGMPVYPTVTQVQDTVAMTALLGNDRQRNFHIRQLVGLVRDHYFDGIDLDYESMAYGGTVADRRLLKDRFVSFARELAKALHASGKKLSITVGARTSDSDYSNWAVYDYAGLGAAADRFRIMTYDYGWSGGDPNPVAPYWWVETVIKYAIERVPAGKVWVGVPSYGYDWPTSGGRGKAVSFAKANQLRYSAKASRVWVEKDSKGRLVRAPMLTYLDEAGDKHTVWYNDEASIRRIVAFVGTYRLGGAAMWALGGEDPAMWSPVADYAETISKTSTKVALWSPTTTVTYGATVRLKARLTDSNGAVLAGRRMSLQRRYSVNDPWVTMATRESQGDGTVAFTITPAAGKQYRVTAAGTWSLNSTESAPRSYRVARKVSATPVVSRVGQVRTIVLKGQILPVKPAVTVAQQRLTSKGWVTMATVKTSTTGGYRVSVQTRSTGTPTFRARVVATAPYVAGASTKQRVVVR